MVGDSIVEIFRQNGPWEEKGRGVAIFSCPTPSYDPTVLPQGTCPVTPQRIELALTVPERVLVTGFDDRLLADDAAVRPLVDRVLLPCYRERIPVYLFTPAPLSFLKRDKLPFGDFASIEESMARLRREQLGRILSTTCVCFADPSSLAEATYVPQTPIEATLSQALRDLGIAYEQQVPAGPFVVDFVLEGVGGARLGVEVDGREFHDAERDARRDRQLIERHGFIEVVRFVGSDVWHDAARCARIVRERLERLATIPATAPSVFEVREDLRLSAEQEPCLAPTGGPVLTLAPAGSGKTRVLARRVLEAVRCGAKPERVLCLVFNKRAETSMAKRIHAERALGQVVVKTLHAIGNEIVTSSADSPYKGFEVMNKDYEVRKLVRTAVERHAAPQQGEGTKKKRALDDLVAAYSQYIGVYKRTLAEIGGGDLDSSVKGFSVESARRVRDEVDESLHALQRITFDDMIYRAVEVLLTEPKVRAVYQSRYDVVLVDEVQDLTPVQFLLVRILALPMNNLFAVGDDDQMIYSFTGADPRNLKEFQELFKGSSTYTLGQNFRCADAIVERSANLISHNLARFPKDIRPAKTESRELDEGARTFLADSPELEAKEAVAQIQRWHERGFAYGDVAILVRVRGVAGIVQAALRAAEIPHVPLSSSPFFTGEAVEIVRSQARVCLNPMAAVSKDLDACLRRPNRSLSWDLCMALSKAGWPALTRLEGVPSYAERSVRDYVDAVGRVGAEAARGGPASAVLDFMVGQLGIEAYLAKEDRNGTNTEALTGVDALRILRSMSEQHGTFAEFVSWLDEQASEETRFSQEDKDRKRGDEVLVQTVHKTKGEEFKCVVLFHVDENVLPHRHAVESRLESAMEEERRVCYVGVTRAVNSLLVTATTGARSRFLAEMEAPRQIQTEWTQPKPESPADAASGGGVGAEARKIPERPKTLLGSIVQFLAELFRG